MLFGFNRSIIRFGVRVDIAQRRNELASQQTKDVAVAGQVEVLQKGQVANWFSFLLFRFLLFWFLFVVLSFYYWLFLQLDLLSVCFEISNERHNCVKTIVDAFLLLFLMSDAPCFSHLIKVLEQLFGTEKTVRVQREAIDEEYMLAAASVLQKVNNSQLPHV